MGQPGFGHDPQSKAARVTVVGHASTRWLGAKNRADASRLNEALSKRRAENVRTEVEKILKREIPMLTILPGTSGPMPDGIAVGSYGVGSREPVLNPAPERISPQENNPVNRSVVVFIELVTTHYGDAEVSLPPRRISARTRFWYGQVETLLGGAVGVATYFLRVRLRNSLSDKSATYTGYIIGGGAGATFSRGKPNDPIGHEFSFYTDEAMGFDDFQGQLVKLEVLKASLGIRASTQYITFVGLGSGAKMLGYEHSIGVGLPKLNAFAASGTVSREGPNPGDWFEVEDSTTVPWARDSKTNDGLIVSFPTGKSEVGDLGGTDRQMLENYTVLWARRM